MYSGFSRVHMTFYILTKWYTVPGNQGTLSVNFSIDGYQNIKLKGILKYSQHFLKWIPLILLFKEGERLDR